MIGSHCRYSENRVAVGRAYNERPWPNITIIPCGIDDADPARGGNISCDCDDHRVAVQIVIRIVICIRIEKAVSKAAGDDIDSDRIEPFDTRHPVILLADIFAIDVLGLRESDRGLICRADKLSGGISRDTTETACAVAESGNILISGVRVVIDGRVVVYKIVFCDDVEAVERAMCKAKTRIEDSDEDALAGVSHFVEIDRSEHIELPERQAVKIIFHDT